MYGKMFGKVDLKSFKMVGFGKGVIVEEEVKGD